MKAATHVAGGTENGQSQVATLPNISEEMGVEASVWTALHS